MNDLSSLDGLWIAEFSGNGMLGTGVLTVRGSQILGGDSSYYYFGEIAAMDAGAVRGILHVQHYSGPPSNVFSHSSLVSLTFEGASSGEMIIARLNNRDNVFSTGSVKLRRVVRNK